METSVREQRELVREVDSRGQFPVFDVGGFILVARVRNPGRLRVSVTPYKRRVDSGVLFMEDKSVLV